MGISSSLDGWSMSAKAVVDGIELPIAVSQFFTLAKNNLDGSGCYVPLTVTYWPLLDITFTFTFQGVTQTFIATITA